jgi:hypothetical protein
LAGCVETWSVHDCGGVEVEHVAWWSSVVVESSGWCRDDVDWNAAPYSGSI